VNCYFVSLTSFFTLINFFHPLHAELSTLEYLNQNQLTQVGDMIVESEWVLDPEQESSEDGISSQYVLKTVRPWVNGILRYQFSKNINQRERQEFLSYCSGMGEFADVKCLPKRQKDKDFIFIEKTNENVCGLSYLGRAGGQQPLKIRCWRRRTIQHELMHAFGVAHEHNRMDRDDYISIIWENLDDRFRSQYYKVKLDQVALYLNYYDFDSILHYDSYSGSKNGKIVFYRRENKSTVKQTESMSFGDHYTLYALYGGTRPR